MNLSPALLLWISSASKALSAGTSSYLRAVGGSVRIGSSWLEVHVHSLKGFFFSGSFEYATTSRILQEDQTEIYSVYMFSFSKYALANAATVD